MRHTLPTSVHIAVRSIWTLLRPWFPDLACHTFRLWPDMYRSELYEAMVLIWIFSVRMVKRSRTHSFKVRTKVYQTLAKCWNMTCILAPLVFQGALPDVVDPYLELRGILAYAILMCGVCREHRSLQACLGHMGVNLEQLMKRWTYRGGLYFRACLLPDHTKVAYIGETNEYRQRHRTFLSAIRAGGRTYAEMYYALHPKIFVNSIYVPVAFINDRRRRLVAEAIAKRLEADAYVPIK